LSTVINVGFNQDIATVAVPSLASCIVNIKLHFEYHQHGWRDKELSCAYLAHRELESLLIFIVVVVFIITNTVTIFSIITVIVIIIIVRLSLIAQHKPFHDAK